MVATGTLFVVATPIGNLEDMSPRAVRVLGDADVIAAEDTRSARKLFERFGIDTAEVVSLFAGNEASRTDWLMAALSGGRSVAVISEAGMPGISDPGERLVAAARAAELRVEVIPGPVAAIAALVGSGLPTGQFAFHGFPPREAGARRMLYGRLAQESATLVFYEAPGRVGESLADLADAFGDDRTAVLARELTKIHEEYVRGSLSELRDRFSATAPRGECTLVVAGAPASASRADVDVVAEMRLLLADGLGPKDAAARLVVKTGKPRRALYQLALSIQRERGER